MKLDPTAAGVRLRFESAEAEIMVQAFDDLLTALDEMGPGDAVWERLYPAAFADVDAADEFREMVGEDLDNARRERLRACRADVLGAQPAPRRRQEMVLEVEGLERWVTALNDLRLAIGTRLGVTADTGPRIDPFSPSAHDQAVYQWLTAVQDELVEAAMA
jgi:Domain of unknown function (DUF2017)